MTNLNESNISEYIDNARLDPMRIDTFFLQEFQESKIKDNLAMVLNGDCILDKYQKILDQFKSTREFSKEEFEHYKYNPKALSYELYNTTELWFLLLHVNNMYSPIEFTKNPCNVYTSDIINTLNEILNIEIDVKNLNNEDVVNDTKNFTLIHGK